MMRLINICVIAALVLAAADVYKIKFESTRQAQRVVKLRMEIRREQDAIAALRADWAKLDSPARIQDLARRHLPQIEVAQVGDQQTAGHHLLILERTGLVRTASIGQLGSL